VSEGEREENQSTTTFFILHCFVLHFSLRSIVYLARKASICPTLQGDLRRIVECENIIGDSAREINDDRGDRRGRPIASRSTTVLLIVSGIMAGPKGAKTSAAADNTGVHAKNTINVAMEDLT
jgi:hypothetical protein